MNLSLPRPLSPQLVSSASTARNSTGANDVFLHEQGDNHRYTTWSQIGLAAVDRLGVRGGWRKLAAYPRSWAMESARPKPACGPLCNHRRCSEGGRRYDNPNPRQSPRWSQPRRVPNASSQQSLKVKTKSPSPAQIGTVASALRGGLPLTHIRRQAPPSRGCFKGL